MKKAVLLIIIWGVLFLGATRLFAAYMPLKGGGNIGIGTTAPGALLDVGKGTRTNIDGVNDLLVAGDLEVDGTIYGTLASSSETDPTLTNDGGVTLGDGSSNTTALTFNADGGTDGTIVWDGINDDLTILNGNVGIGTTSPTSVFEVVADTEGGLSMKIASDTSNLNPIIYSTRSRGTVAAPTIVSSQDTLFEIYSAGYDGAAYRKAGSITLTVDGTPGASDMPGRWDFFTTPDGSASQQNRMTIKNSGNVGIGTSVPARLLEVAMNQNASTVIKTTNTTAGTSAEAALLMTSDAGSFWISNTSTSYTGWSGDSAVWVSGNQNLRIGTNATERIRVTSDGNVGIGFSTPIGRLDVRGDEARIWTGAGTNTNATTSGELYVEGDLEVDGTIYGTLASSAETDPTLTNDGGVTIGAAGNTVTLTFDGGTTDGVLTWDDINDDFSTTSGNVGIGTTSPRSVLAVSGGVAIGSSYSGTYAAPANGLLIQGNVGIGTTAPTSSLHVSSDVESGMDMDIANNSATLNPLISTVRSRGTIDSPTLVSDGDTLFEIYSEAYDGSANRIAGTILLEVDGTPGASDMPGRWSFSTTPDGSASEQTRMTINNQGNVGIGTTASMGALDVRGDEARIWTGAGTNTNAIASGELYVQGDLEADGTIYGAVNGILQNPMTADMDSAGFMIESNSLGLRFDPDDDGAAELIFNTAGNIGIGMTTPARQLETGGGNVHFQNSSQGTGFFWDAAKSGLGIGTTALGINSDSRIHIVGDGDEAITIETTASTAGPHIELKQNAADGGRHYQIFSTGSGNSGAGRFGIRDETASAWRINVDSAGNVGIGTTLNKNVLDIEGGAAIGTAYSGSYAAPANGLIVQGNVAIGTTGAIVVAGESATLSIVKTSGTNLTLGAPDTKWKTINFYDSTSGETWQWAHGRAWEENRLESWYYNGASWIIVLVLTTGGNVGIGTTGPQKNLHIRGTGTPGFRLANTAADGNVTLDMMETDATGAGIRLLYNGAANQLTFQDQDVSSDVMTIQRAGNVGIGTTSPQQALEVNGDIRTDYNGTATTNGVCHSGADSDTTAADSDLVVCSAAPGDIAEWYETTGSDPGDIVAVTGKILTYEATMVNAMTGEVRNEKQSVKTAILEKSDHPYQSTVLGIISTSPYETFGRGIIEGARLPNPVALIGRVPVKVNLENGPIDAGDMITASSAPGVGMKATKEGRVVGMALEPLRDLEKSEAYAKISVFVKPQWLGGPEAGWQEAGQPISREITEAINKLSWAQQDIKMKTKTLDDRLKTLEIHAN